VSIPSKNICSPKTNGRLNCLCIYSALPASQKKRSVV